MIRIRIWLIACMIFVAGFVSIGLFKPTTSVSTSFFVSRSAATTFRVLTSPASIDSFFADALSVEPQIEGDEKRGNRYQVFFPEGRKTASVELIDFQDLNQFTFLSKTDTETTQTTYSLVREANRTRIDVSQVISPNSWWGKSIQPLLLGSQIERQDRINESLSQLVESSPESLIGEWVATSKEGNEQLFTFKSDGTLDWEVNVGNQVFSLTDIYWVRQSSVYPELIDMSGFTTGPLRGLTLFGIVDMTRRDTLIFDAEAGLPDDDRVRPSAFSDSKVTYVRIR